MLSDEDAKLLIADALERLPTMAQLLDQAAEKTNVDTPAVLSILFDAYKEAESVGPMTAREFKRSLMHSLSVNTWIGRPLISNHRIIGWAF